MTFFLSILFFDSLEHLSHSGGLTGPVAMKGLSETGGFHTVTGSLGVENFFLNVAFSKQCFESGKTFFHLLV